MRRWMGCASVAAAVAVIVLVLLGLGIGTYNGLVRRQIEVDQAWSQVENVYQRRLDLIPNVVETVRGVANFEKETYTAVAEVRSKISRMVITPEILDDHTRFQQFQQAQAELSGALSRLLVTVENYPQLKANQNFLELQSQIESTENRIAVERRHFNEATQRFNSAVRIFPGTVIARMLDFFPKEFFEADAGAEKAPNAKF